MVSPGTGCRWAMCTAQHPARSAGREAKPPTHLWNYPSTQATGSHRPAAMWRQHPHHQIRPRCRNNPPREITVAANVSCSKREEHEARVRMPGDDRMEIFDDQMTRPKFCFSRRHRHSHEITLQLPASASRALEGGRVGGPAYSCPCQHRSHADHYQGTSGEQLGSRVPYTPCHANSDMLTDPDWAQERLHV